MNTENEHQLNDTLKLKLNTNQTRTETKLKFKLKWDNMTTERN